LICLGSGKEALRISELSEGLGDLEAKKLQKVTGDAAGEKADQRKLNGVEPREVK
jgi:hypothetical protein